MLGSVSFGCDSCLLCSMLAPARFTFGLVDSGAVRFGFELGLSRLVFDAFSVRFGFDFDYPGSIRAWCLDGLGLVRFGLDVVAVRFAFNSARLNLNYAGVRSSAIWSLFCPPQSVRIFVRSLFDFVSLRLNSVRRHCCFHLPRILCV